MRRGNNLQEKAEYIHWQSLGAFLTVNVCVVFLALVSKTAASFKEIFPPSPS